jgi:hypothetical protein
MFSLPEFFYKRQERNRRSGGNFGQTFTNNFQDTSSKKEVTRDFSVSSSRNVEHSSTFDRKTMNKVRTKKGDKFEEQNWSSSSNNENGDDAEDGGDVLQLPGLPSSFQQALTAARLVKFINFGTIDLMHNEVTRIERNAGLSSHRPGKFRYWLF